MNEKQIDTNSAKAWMLASRPKTLTGAAVPVMIGLAFAARDLGLDDFGWMPALLCVLFAFIMQIDANFINDYFDFVRGNDDETRLGPRRACAQGWITPKCHAPCNNNNNGDSLLYRPAVGDIWRLGDDTCRGVLRGVLFPLHHIAVISWSWRCARVSVFRNYSRVCYLLSPDRQVYV